MEKQKWDTDKGHCLQEGLVKHLGLHQHRGNGLVQLPCRWEGGQSKSVKDLRVPYPGRRTGPVAGFVGAGKNCEFPSSPEN